jgi:multidrug efflux pump subunit AcrA (membrane-fusion protein)
MKAVRWLTARRRRAALALLCVSLSAAVVVAGARRLWAHAEGHDVPGGSSMDLKYPRFLNPVTRETLGIRTAPVMRRPVEEVVRVTGRVRTRPDARATVAAPVAGRVKEIRADIGTAVAGGAGRPLIVLESLEAARLQNDLLAEGRLLRHAREHLNEAAAMSRRTALQAVVELLVQHRAAAEAGRVADEALALVRKGGSAVPRRELVAAEAEHAKAAAAERSIHDRLRTLGIADAAVHAWEKRPDPDPAPLLQDGSLRWERIEVLGRPFDLLEKEHEVAGHEVAVARLSGELRSLGYPDEAIAALAAGTGTPQPLMLVSPLAGTVTARHAHVGLHVAAGQALLEIADRSKVLVDAEVPEALLASVLDRNSDKVRLRTAVLPGTVLEGRVLRIDPEVHPDTRTVHVVVALDNPGGKLPTGAFVEVALVVREVGQALTVPAEAVVRQGPVTFVWVEEHSSGGETEYEKRDVVVGAVDDQYAEIVRGDLSPSDRVVTRGAYQLTLIPAVARPDHEH